MGKNTKSETHFGVDEPNPETLVGLSKRIRECAELAGSGDKLSQLSAIPRRTLETYLAGESEPKALRAAAIARAVGVSCDWLLTGKGEMRPGEGSTCEDALEDEFAMIPVYNIYVSAGGGALPGPESAIRQDPISRKRLRARGLKESHLAKFLSRGDSMEKTISDKAAVTVDLSQTDLIDGEIFVVRMDGHLVVKRIQNLPGQKFLLISDNQAYRPIEVVVDGAYDIKVIGKVVTIENEI